MTLSYRAARRKSRIRKIKLYRWCYVMFLPVLAYLLVFRYWPLISQFVLACVDYNLGKGIFGSKFVGLANFQRMFTSRNFWNIVWNTVAIAGLKILWGFLPPIVLAVFLNDMLSRRYRKISQTIVYIPHFLSWIIVYGVAYAFLSQGFGILNDWLEFFGLKRQNFLVSSGAFRSIIVITHLWKTMGWGTIIYLAALSGVDVALYEAASIDGANVWQRLRHITLPSIKPVVVFVLTLSLGSILTSGFEQVLLFQTTATYSVSDTLETWTYRRGLIDMEFSFATAVGLVQSIVGLVMVLTSNVLSKKFANTGIW